MAIFAQSDVPIVYIVSKFGNGLSEFFIKGGAVMDRNTIKKRCETYINAENISSEYALMLTGNWGCGKTFLSKEIIKERNEADGVKLAWYISAFGVKNADDLNDKLFEAAHPLLGDSQSKKWLSVGYGVLKSAAKYKFNVDINNVVDPITKVINGKDEKPAGCQVLFVDDVERTDIDIKELFGYFMPIIEGGTRVIFIANEEEIKDTVNYKKMKEKIIGETYKVEPEYEKSIEVFWKEGLYKEQSQSEERKQDFIRIVKKMGVKNLRILRQIIQQWELFLCQLPVIYQQDKEYFSEIFEAYVVLLISCKMEIIKTSGNHIFENNKDDNIVKQFQEFWDRYKRNTAPLQDSITQVDAAPRGFQNQIVYHLRCAELWPQILLEGNNEDKWLMQNLQSDYIEHQKRVERLKRKERNIEKLRDLVFQGTDHSLLSIEDLFGSLFQDFEEGKYTRFDEIMLYIQIYCALLDEKILPREYSFDKLGKQLASFLEKFKSSFSALPGFERVREENLVLVGNESIQGLIREIFQAAKNVTVGPEDKVFHDKNTFLVYIRDAQKGLNEYLNVPFLCQMNIDELFDWLGNDISTHENLLHFLELRYRIGFSNSTLQKNDYDDLGAVDQLHKKYVQCCETMDYTYRLDVRNYRLLKKKYENIFQYMKSSIESAS